MGTRPDAPATDVDTPMTDADTQTTDADASASPRPRWRRGRWPRGVRCPGSGWASAAPRRWAPAVLALWYPLILTAGTLLLDAQPAGRRQEWLDWLSTNLNNLSDNSPPLLHPVGALLGSGAVCEDNLIAWAVLATVGLVALGQRVGPGAAAGLVIAVHVLATGVSQGVLAVRVATGAEPDSVRAITDVGPSYLIVAALIAGALIGRPLAGRVLAGLGFLALAPSLFGGLTAWEVAPVGHLSSLLLAAAISAALARRPPHHP